MTSAHKRSIGLIDWLGAVIVVIALGGGALISSPTLRQATGLLGSRTGYAVGQIADLPDAAYRDSPVALVIFGRASCSACVSAESEMRSMVASTRALAGRAAIILATPSPPADPDLAMAERLGIRPADVVAVDAGLVRVGRIPTILLVDSTRKIVFVGQTPLAPGDRARLEEALKMQQTTTR